MFGQGSAYGDVRRLSLNHGTILSSLPSGWLAKATKPIRFDQSDVHISNVLYLPSFFDLEGENIADAVVDDGHFVSHLCDRGFAVHTLMPFSSKDATGLLSEALSVFTGTRIGLGINEERAGRTTPRNIAIIGHELSCHQLLSFLSEVALPMSPNRVDIGAVVLLDPPPIQSLLSKEGRRRILQRYAWPILKNSSIADKILELNDNPKKDATKRRTKKSKKNQRTPEKIAAEEEEYWKSLDPEYRLQSQPEPERSAQRYINYLRSKGDEGNFVIELAKKVRQTIRSKDTYPSNPINPSVNLTLATEADDRQYEETDIDSWQHLTTLSEDEVTLYKETFLSDTMNSISMISLASQLANPNPKRRYTLNDGPVEADRQKCIHSNEQSISRMTIEKEDALMMTMTGRYPVCIREARETMKNRILLLATENLKQASSQDISTAMDTSYGITVMHPLTFQQRNPEDDWSYEAVEELATLYQTGPVIYVEDIEEDEDDDLTCIGVFPESCSDTKLVVEEDLVSFEESTSVRNRKIATAISDWLQMLPHFRYL